MRRRQFLTTAASATGALALPLVGPGWTAAAVEQLQPQLGSTFDLETGNAGVEVVIPDVIAAIFEIMIQIGALWSRRSDWWSAMRRSM